MALKDPIDPRDCPVHTLEWRAMPKAFECGRQLFGGPMYNHKSRSRQRLDRIIDHACTVWREKYGACTERRCLICKAQVTHCMEEGVKAKWRDKNIAVIPYLEAIFKKRVNSEEAHEAMKATVVPTRTKLPTFTKVPA